MIRLIYITTAIVCVAFTRVAACGYDFVGGCSSGVNLKVNGTEGAFALASCENQLYFQGFQLGNIQSLRLSGADVITWESCTNNITSAALYYRVFRTGQAPGAWQNLVIPEDHNIVEGPYTTRYRDVDSDINLSGGLLVGNNYTMEVYIRAEVDTIGDDFIPETYITQHNGGQNFKLQFVYGGPAAPPLNAVVTRDKDVDCWGKATGEAGVTVFGGLPGGTLFYQWSSNTQNFFIIDSLPAGNYTVTVTDNPSGNTATATIAITQPTLPVMLSFTNVTPASCNGPGSATVVASGGTGALHWEWSNGDTLATTYFPTEGHYAITVTDSKGCTQKGMVMINGTGDVPLFELPVICAGEVYTRGNQTFTQEGLYTVNIPAPNGCDTVVEFYLHVVPSAELLATLPTEVTLTCLQPVSTVCAVYFPGATYSWTKDGILWGGNAPCNDISSSGLYTLTVITTDGTKVCQTAKNIVVDAHLTAGVPAATGTGSLLPPCGSGAVALVCTATHPDPVSTWTWTFNNAVISTTNTCTLNLSQPIAVLPTLTVVDIYGCSATVTPDVTFEAPPGFPSITGATQQTQCNGTVAVTAGITGGNPPYDVWWSAGQTGNPIVLIPGFYFVNVTDALGCAASVGVLVEDFSINVTGQAVSAPSAEDGVATVVADGAYQQPLAYLWDTGDTTSVITQLSPGDYCVTVTDATGCTRDTCLTISTLTSGVTQPFAGSGGLLLYPVPASPGSSIHFDPFPEDREWILSNVTGQECDRQTIKAGETTVQLPENLPGNVCFCMIKNQHYFRVGKIFLITGR